MNYKETTEYLFCQLPVYQKIGGIAYKEGLDNSLALDQYFNRPHKKYRTIHVAGTNGKGSTSHLLAAILHQSGYRVGLYTSPHLVDFRERIRVDGQMISEQYVVDFVAKHRAYYEPIQPSFFELTMMMAFQYFADMRVEVAIIETGLGGRLDSTNIITPDLCTITNISLDHVQFLGDTPEKIAIEKAGIIKANIPVVIGEAKDGVRTVFETVAREVNAPIIFAEDRNLILSTSQTISNSWLFQSTQYPDLKGELGGYAQIKNANTVLTAVEQLQKMGYTIPDKAVYEGFARVIELTGLMGRWQCLQNRPKIVCDTGHNTAGVEYIVQQLSTESYDNLHVIIGMVNDKDVSKILSLLPKEATYYFTKAAIPRSLDESELKHQASKQALWGESYPNVEQALKTAMNNANEEDFIFIGGSNFIVADALIMLNKQ